MNGTNSSAKHYDMVVIGSGAAGRHGAILETQYFKLIDRSGISSWVTTVGDFIRFSIGRIGTGYCCRIVISGDIFPGFLVALST
jgi:hypothetical protein